MAILKEAAHQLDDSVPPNTPSHRADLATPLDLPTCWGKKAGVGGWQRLAKPRPRPSFFNQQAAGRDADWRTVWLGRDAAVWVNYADLKSKQARHGAVPLLASVPNRCTSSECIF